MKKMAALFLAGSLAFAGNIYSKDNQEQKQIKMPFIFKATTLNDIKNVGISHNDKKVLITTKNKVKIFNSQDGELIKVLKLNNIIKSAFSNDNKKLFILTKNKFYTYDAATYNEIGHINVLNKHTFNDFFIRNDILGLVEKKNYAYNYFAYIFNTKTANKISSFHFNNDIIYHSNLSPNIKKIAFSSYRNSFIYNLDGEFLNKLSRGGSYGIKWVDNKNVVAYSSDYAYILNVKTGEIVAKIEGKPQIDEVEVLNNDNILVFNDNEMKIYNISKGRFLNEIFIVEGRNSQDDIEYVALSDDKRYLVIAYRSKDTKFYNTSKIFNNFINENNSNENILQETPQTTETKPQVIIKKVVEPKVIVKKEIVEKVVVKKVKEKENKKPTLTIYASTTEGEAPLSVNFKFLANDEDGKIAYYYVNFAGKEIMHKGNPTKSFNYTFKHPGKYKIMVAVKDDKNAITTKQVIINVKPKHEETFEDYKRSLMGN